MIMPILTINLDRSPQRWEAISGDAGRYGLDVCRIVGVDGQAIARPDWIDVDEAGFSRGNGRAIMAGEYGCYRSHLNALDHVVKAELPFAIITEDDIVVSSSLPARAEAIAAALDRHKGGARGFDLVKLVNHRAHGFVRTTISEHGDEIGRTLWGPQGSAAAYLVSFEGARRLREALAIMRFPFDLALERAWATGISAYTLKDNLLAFSDHRSRSTIAEHRLYQTVKRPFWARGGAALTRAYDTLARILYALRGAMAGRRGGKGVAATGGPRAS